MADFTEVFVQNIIPIFIVAAIGYGLRSRLGLDPKPLSAIVFYGLSPALVFSSLVETRLAAEELGRIALFALLVTLTVGLIGAVLAKAARLGRPETAALLLCLMFVNSGNYGLTLNQLRYGEPGLARAVVYYIVSTILVYTLGSLIASLGRADLRSSLRRLAGIPALYAVGLALLAYGLRVELPAPLMSGIHVAGSGAIPLMLVILGMQLAGLREIRNLRLAGPAALGRLAVAPLIALLLAGWLGLEGLSRSTSIIEASMPTAVITIILATQFDLLPGLVTATVLLSTLLSAVSLPIVISLLSL
ncbi:MAG: AEC family transporter [Candidatus Promineifilaceae bacterium]